MVAGKSWVFWIVVGVIVYFGWKWWQGQHPTQTVQQMRGRQGAGGGGGNSGGVIGSGG